MAPSWELWIDETARPGWANMSIDLALLDRAERKSESWVRLYRWNPRCLSFGRHEPAARRYNGDRIRRLGVDTVRRPTGGRAVWHESELTYAVACPSWRFGSLRTAYSEIHTLLASAINSLGFAANLAPEQRPAALHAGPCFAQPVGGEVLVNGRKVIGSAQVQRGTALLQHGSILLRDDQQRVSDLLQGRSVPNRPTAGGVSPLASLQADEVAKAVSEAARAHWIGVRDPAADPYEVVLEAAEHHPHFRSDAWTWVR